MSRYSIVALGQRDASVLRRFEEFCALEGLAVDRALKNADAVEAFLTIGCSTLRAHSLGTYRSTLRRRGSFPTSRQFPASPAPLPYSERDLAALWSRARSQASRARVHNATVLLAAMVGAGLRPREVAHLRGSDVRRLKGRVLVRVRGASRLVPVRDPDAGVLVALADEQRGYLFRPAARVRDTKNLVGEIAGSLAGDPDEVALSSGRARSTFICGHLASDTPLRELCVWAGLHDVESLLRYARHVSGASDEGPTARTGASTMSRRMIEDDEVVRCLALVERSGVAGWLEAGIEARYRRPGRPRELSVAALLTALLLLATDDRALHLSGATEVLFCRLSNEAKATLGVTGEVRDARSFLARYRQVRYLFHAVASVLDPSGLAKNHRLGVEEFAQRCATMSEDDSLRARDRLESFMSSLLSASVEGCERPSRLAYGLDATPVPLFSRGPSKRRGHCATDPDGGWYVREGDHREREDHRGRRRSRVAWALEATLLTTASPAPGSLAAFPNLVVGLALDRPGVDPGGTALRVLAGARSRGFAPGSLGVDRAYSGALATNFHLPVRAMGFALVIDYRVDQLGRQANSHGAVLVEGAWYCPGMPEALVRATIDLRAGAIDADTYRQRIDARRAYQLRRKSGPDVDGYERFMCPAQGTRPKVRCELRPTSLAVIGARTLNPPTSPPLLCSQHAVTIAPDVAARHAQSFAYGSEEWARHYATLRNTIEGWNGFVKDPAHEALAQPARRRVRGIAAQGIFVTLLIVAANLRKIETHHRQMVHRDEIEARKRTRRRRVSLTDYLAS